MLRSFREGEKLGLHLNVMKTEIDFPSTSVSRKQDDFCKSSVFFLLFCLAVFIPKNLRQDTDETIIV